MTDPPADTGAQLLERLSEISRQIEACRAQVWRLRLERRAIRVRLHESGWKPPQVKL